jgi:hypothetical protein
MVTVTALVEPASGEEVIEHRYVPRGTAMQLLECRDKEVLISGPAGTGKSRACIEKIHLLALINPGMRALMARKTQVSMTSTGLVTYREHVAKEAITTGIVRWYGGSQEEAAGYRYSNGSIINVGGMDKPTKIMSSEYDVAYVQESIELTEADWEAITSRLRNGKISFQQLIADTNPDTEIHWLKQRCDRGTTTMLNSRHEDNPVLFDRVIESHQGKETVRYVTTTAGQSYIEILNNLTGVRKLRLRDGLWVAAEGIVFEDWNPTIHMVDRFKIPDEWTRWWVVDFGHTNPFVLQCWAEDPDGRLYRYREIYMTGRLVEDHAKQIMRIVCPGATWDDKNTCWVGGNWIEPKPRAIICDHDAEDRATLKRYLGLGTKAATKTVLDGIDAVSGRMRVAKDGKPRVLFLRDSLVERDPKLVAAKLPCNTEEEIPGYVWDRAPGKAPKEAPVKENDHGCDTLRYMIAERDLRPQGSPYRYFDE